MALDRAGGPGTRYTITIRHRKIREVYNNVLLAAKSQLSSILIHLRSDKLIGETGICFASVILDGEAHNPSQQQLWRKIHHASSWARSGNFWRWWNLDYDGDTNGVIAAVGNNCDLNGVPCTAAEFSLVSGVTSADITLIPPHQYNKSLRITLTNGLSKVCTSANCPGAFHTDGNDQLYQIQESGNPNSGITLDFCI
ncbi:hypothetical protein H4Q26_008267 [Puccinia striiformis f. sp. tritici PST-130]|nr:hypothetical protein H4Q26_008267 [Puccinia striiformis f. sp. tritici PST-130]